MMNHFALADWYRLYETFMLVGSTIRELWDRPLGLASSRSLAAWNLPAPNGSYERLTESSAREC